MKHTARINLPSSDRVVRIVAKRDGALSGAGARAQNVERRDGTALRSCEAMIDTAKGALAGTGARARNVESRDGPLRSPHVTVIHTFLINVEGSDGAVLSPEKAMGHAACVRVLSRDHSFRVEDGYNLWSDRYDREVKDIFEIQDEIARSIAERLKVTLKGEGQEPLLKGGTKNLEAYQLYVKGRALLLRRGVAASRAMECFEREVALDPDYALAWAGLADSQTVLGYSGLARPEVTTPKALEAARRAVALAPSQAEAHNALAMASLIGVSDRAKAEREFFARWS